MDSEQIRAVLEDFKRQERDATGYKVIGVNGIPLEGCALWEIALQLAIANEFNARPVTTPPPFTAVFAGAPEKPPITLKSIAEFLKCRGWVDVRPGMVYSWNPPDPTFHEGGYTLIQALERELAKERREHAG